MSRGADIFAIWPGFVLCLRCPKLYSHSSFFGVGLRSFGWRPFCPRSRWLSVLSCFFWWRLLLLLSRVWRGSERRPESQWFFDCRCCLRGVRFGEEDCRGSRLLPVFGAVWEAGSFPYRKTEDLL